MNKLNGWTLGLLSAGLVTFPAIMKADEKPSSVLTALSSTTLSGYVDTSAQWNMGTGNAYVPAYAFGGSSKADGFNLNVVELNIEKPVEATDVWGAGYKVSLLAGPDANLFGSQSTVSTGASDFAVKQAYVSLHAPIGNGLDFKVGVWDTIIGYEVFESINDPNVTRSYGYTIEPLSHTGVQASYQFSSTLSGTLGIANTFGPVINQRAFPQRAESFKTYMGSLTFTAPTNWGILSGSTITGCIIDGFDNGIGPVGKDQISYYLGATVNTPISGLKAGVCYDYLGVPKQSLGGSSYANAVGLYLSYQLTEKLSLYGRGEYASSDTLANNGANIIGAAKLFETTATLQYDLWKNVLTRVEFRWDHAADDSAAFGGNPPTKSNSYILLADIAYKF
ncbi:MAG TPA: outer membrane beta-barrel protein [Verrucomicrobiae bacterium]|nr:outer membrane beta-barrel protein [Verrucomicrobiae bacterium]